MWDRMWTDVARLEVFIIVEATREKRPCKRDVESMMDYGLAVSRVCVSVRCYVTNCSPFPICPRFVPHSPFFIPHFNSAKRLPNSMFLFRNSRFGKQVWQAGSARVLHGGEPAIHHLGQIHLLVDHQRHFFFLDQSATVSQWLWDLLHRPGLQLRRRMHFGCCITSAELRFMRPFSSCSI